MESWARGVPTYRRGMAVARGGRRWPGLAAINGAPASRRAGGGAEKTAELTMRSAVLRFVNGGSEKAR